MIETYVEWLDNPGYLAVGHQCNQESGIRFAFPGEGEFLAQLSCAFSRRACKRLFKNRNSEIR